MSKLKETEAMINMFNGMLDDIPLGALKGQKDSINDSIAVTAICDIAKSLAIIADTVSKEDAK